MKFWTNIATLLVVSVSATEDKEESFGRHRHSPVEEDVALVHRLFDLDTYEVDIRDDEQEMERFLGIGGLSMSFVPTVSTRAFGKSKDGKSKSKDGKAKDGKSKDGKSKSKDGVKSKSNKDSKTLRNASKSKSGKESDGKEGGKEGQKRTKDGDEVKVSERIVVTKNEKGRRVLGIGFSGAERIEMDNGKSKSGKAKAGKAKSGKGKAGKQQRQMQMFVMDFNKLSLPSSSKVGKSSTIPPNRKLTPAPTGSKGNSRRYKVRRRTSQTSSDEWKSNSRELGSHCSIGNPSKMVGIDGNIPGKEGTKAGSKSGSKEGSGYGSKSGSKEGVGYGSKSGSKEGTKSGSKGGIDRRDRGRRRTEIGLYACYLSGSWTCCKEYGDMGDDPVCCKGDYVEPAVGRISPGNSKTTSSSNTRNSGTSTSGVSSASRGPERVNPSFSNDLPPPAVASPGLGGNPSMGRAHQDPVTMKVVHDWQSNDQQMN